ncbi:Squalene/phytoene synthase-domain-containing protein [Amylocarpus encephaloides]|uniref:Bifunctional lycopene cyclase/phytoene synthase n=1 Tax=Amylocarpus encephaloides TaxID=45428 RepID=A0A9P7YHR0_9HELO|nr:Squalene/phytoene synthase-domain-containing protein [Amylocarpus encephaloides]
MGFEYALVHLKYTIPPAAALTFLYRPLLTRIDIYRVAFLITIAVVSTIPWDSYLIRRKIWTYPPSVIVGPRLFSIPAEEIFFFVVQTYNTSLLYLLLSKPTFHSAYLVPPKAKVRSIKWCQGLGQVLLAACVLVGAYLIWRGNEGTYLGLILAWAGPFALLLWSLSSQLLVTLPITSTWAPILIPTVYLWIVDTLALRRGTWTIESGTKFGIHVWDGLEIEEAIFFLATNTLIVFGQVAFDHAVAIQLTLPRLYPHVSELPSPTHLIQALLASPAEYDEDRVEAISQAVKRLQEKSRSFYLASSTFSGRLRIDLILLYSFCRVADDLVDNAKSESAARDWIRKLTRYLDLTCASEEAKIRSKQPDAHRYSTVNFPESARSALHLLPTHLLSFGPLYDLLEGFKTDLGFHQQPGSLMRTFPIATSQDLERYAARVAGTVAELILELVFFHSSSSITDKRRGSLFRAGGNMGIALQYVNIARDIATDAAIGRVYLPTSWLKECGMVPQDVLEDPNHPKIDALRSRLLDKAFAVYDQARVAMAQLPSDARSPMRVAVESYMEIGRVLREKGYKVKQGKATVSKLRRFQVAWKVMHEE